MSFIVTVTFAVAQSPSSSHTEYSKASVPKKSAFGVYATSPVVGSIAIVPFDGAVISVTLVGSIVPSKSVSFAKMPITTTVSSSVLAVSSVAVGGEFETTQAVASPLSVTAAVVSCPPLATFGTPFASTLSPRELSPSRSVAVKEPAPSIASAQPSPSASKSK